MSKRSTKLKGVEILDNQIIFYVVLLLTVLTLISHFMSGKLLNIGIFAIVAGVTWILNKNPTVIMLSAIVITWLFTMIRGNTEGFKQDNKDKKDKNHNKQGFTTHDEEEEQEGATPPQGSPAKVSSSFEGFEHQIKETQNMVDALKHMSPALDKMQGFLNSMPPELVQKAVDKMTNNMNKNGFKARR